MEEPEMPRESAGDEEGFAERKARWCSLRDSVNLISLSQAGLFILALGFVLHRSKAVLLPVVLAMLASLVLYPVYMAFRRIRFPRLLASAATVAGLVAMIGFGTYQLVEPGSRWMESIDSESVANRLQQVFRPVKEMRDELKEVADRVERVARADGTPEEPDHAERSGNGSARLRIASPPQASGNGAEDDAKGNPVVVEIHEDPLDAVVVTTQDLGLGMAAFLILVLFSLAYGKRIVNCLGEREGTALILERMGADVSKYLFTITLINLSLGLCIALAMWGLGMPNPALWGVLGMLLNYIPYVGALIGTGVVFLVAAASFDSPALVLIVPCVYFGLTALEGNLVTPLVLGGRFQLNPLVVFLWVFAWAGFWGVAGMLIAMPALVSFKIICENTATMERFRRVLSS